MMRSAPLVLAAVVAVACGRRHGDMRHTLDLNEDVFEAKFEQDVKEDVVADFAVANESQENNDRLRADVDAAEAALVATGVRKQAAKPNVIYLFLDDLGSADVSFYHKAHAKDGEKPRIVTSNIDSLADSGITLKQYYSHELCAPARSALMTCRYATNLGNPFPFKGEEPSFAGSCDRKFKLFPQELAERGYINYAVGKWGLEGEDRTRPQMGPGSGWGPTERGFHHFFGIVNSGHNHYTKSNDFRKPDKVEMNRWTKDGPQLNESSGVDVEPLVHSTTLFTREAINYMQGHRQNHPDKPFFLYWATTAPHDPLQSEESWMEHSSCKDMPSWRRKTYCGMVIGLDEGIGNMTRAMTEVGVDLDNTIIMFSSDNGGASIVGGINAPFRGGKMGSWEGSARVAAFIRAPALLGEGVGRVFNGMMHIVDFGPTILSLIDGVGNTNTPLLNDQGPIDGMDISSALRDNTASPRTEALISTNTFPNRSSFVMNVANSAGSITTWKLIMGFPGAGTVDIPSDNSDYKTEMTLVERWDQWYREMLVSISIDYYGLEWSSWGLMLMVQGWTLPVWGGVSPRSRLENELETLPISENMPEPEFDAGKVWLFDLAADPYEKNNMVEGNEEIVIIMKDRIHEIIKNAENQGWAMGYSMETLTWVHLTVWIMLLLLFSGCCCCCCGCCGQMCNTRSRVHVPFFTAMLLKMKIQQED